MRVPGYRFAGVRCGLKQSGKRDVALIVSDVPAVAAAAFTTNRVQAAPVVVARGHAARGSLQAIVVNSGNANAYTGRDGLAVARRMTQVVAERLGIDAAAVAPCSTGRIGVPLPRSRVLRGVAEACARLDRDGFHEALEGIMTTDAFPKIATRRLRIGRTDVTVTGMAKGAGMIAPRMATMLAFVMTDARVARAALGRVLRQALPESFNQIVVDGDTSTNDTVILLANGVAANARIEGGTAAWRSFSAAVTAVMRDLARQVVRDGEGATKVIDIVVRGARTAADAARAADAIARSPLCKTAFFGGDPYAGRIVCAIGYSGARFEPERLDVFVDEVQIVRHGVEVVRRVEKRAERVVRAAEFTLTIDLHAGRATARRVASDLSVDYVRFNSAYRT